MMTETAILCGGSTTSCTTTASSRWAASSPQELGRDKSPTSQLGQRRRRLSNTSIFGQGKMQCLPYGLEDGGNDHVVETTTQVTEDCTQMTDDDSNDDNHGSFRHPGFHEIYMESKNSSFTDSPLVVPTRRMSVPSPIGMEITIIQLHDDDDEDSTCSCLDDNFDCSRDSPLRMPRRMVSNHER